MGRLTEAQRNQAIGMLRFEIISQVAKFFNCSKSTISRLADRFAQTGTVKDRPRPGQQKKNLVYEMKGVFEDNTSQVLFLRQAQQHGSSALQHQQLSKSCERFARSSMAFTKPRPQSCRACEVLHEVINTLFFPWMLFKFNECIK